MKSESLLLLVAVEVLFEAIKINNREEKSSSRASLFPSFWVNV